MSCDLTGLSHWDEDHVSTRDVALLILLVTMQMLSLVISPFMSLVWKIPFASYKERRFPSFLDEFVTKGR